MLETANLESENNLTSLSDVELVSLICKSSEKDDELFGEILNRYQRQILIYCTRFLNWHLEKIAKTR